MITVAIAPNVKGISKLAVNDHAKWKAADEASTKYQWSSQLTWLFWTRVFMIALMLGLPVSLIGLSFWSLMGYTALLAIPARHALVKGKVKTNYVDVTAYKFVSQLKDGWKDHGDVFYKQIWDHDCNGEQISYGFYEQYDHDGRPRRNVKRFTRCDHCEKRLVELEALVESQKETELKIKTPLEEQLFESSEQFRRAVAEQSEESNIMKQISEGVKNGKNR